VSLTDARRIAVRAQLLDARQRDTGCDGVELEDSGPDDSVPDDIVSIVEHLTFVQVEPTARIAPTADLVLWSRLGADRYREGELLDAVERGNELFELNLVVRPLGDLPLFLARMALAPEHESARRWLEDNREFRDDVIERLDVDGPLVARDIADSSIVPWTSSGWNDNRNVVMMLEILAARGEVAVVGRRGRDRLWDLGERRYHSDVVPVPIAEADRLRNERRLRALGIVRTRTTELPGESVRVGDAGEPATIDGLSGEWRVDPDALDGLSRGAFVGRTALLSPFDALVRDRKRMAALFDFDYALEMYTPAAKRRWGFYALPVLHGERLVGKVDATADRAAGRLHVHAVHEDVPFTPEMRDGVDREIADLARFVRLRAEHSAVGGKHSAVSTQQ
jgi:uncharacterized protein YcaQ